MFPRLAADGVLKHYQLHDIINKIALFKDGRRCKKPVVILFFMKKVGIVKMSVSIYCVPVVFIEACFISC